MSLGSKLFIHYWKGSRLFIIGLPSLKASKGQMQCHFTRCSHFPNTPGPVLTRPNPFSWKCPRKHQTVLPSIHSWPTALRLRSSELFWISNSVPLCFSVCVVYAVFYPAWHNHAGTSVPTSGLWGFYATRIWLLGGSALPLKLGQVGQGPSFPGLWGSRTLTGGPKAIPRLSWTCVSLCWSRNSFQGYFTEERFCKKKRKKRKKEKQIRGVLRDPWTLKTFSHLHTGAHISGLLLMSHPRTPSLEFSCTSSSGVGSSISEWWGHRETLRERFFLSLVPSLSSRCFSLVKVTSLNTYGEVCLLIICSKKK